MIKKILGTLVIAGISEFVSIIVIDGVKYVVRELKNDKIEIDAEQDINEIGSIEDYENELRLAVQA